MRQLVLLFIITLCTGTVFAQAQENRNISLDSLAGLAKQANSSSLIVMQNGELIAEEYFGGEKQLIETMSVTKLIVSVGVGHLYTTGKIDSIGQAVADFYPEWRQGKKKGIAIRHLLEHTSGLQDKMNAHEEIYPSPDIVQLALAAELSEEPGTHTRYNNKAVNLLAGIFKQASGMPMDEYFERKIFSVLGIEDFKWKKGQSGNPYAMAGLAMYGKDVAKFGQLILNDGMWKGKKLISADYLEKMTGTDDGNEFGLLWRKLPSGISISLPEDRIDEFKRKGVPGHIIEGLEEYAGANFETHQEAQQILIDVFGTPQVFHEEMVSRGIETVFVTVYEGIAGYYGDGDLGQYLIVVPGKEMVVVRQKEYSESFNPQRDSFQQLLDLVTRLQI